MKNPIVTRRDFLKISGLSAGTISLVSLPAAPLLSATNVYPGGKITFVVPNKPGGGFDLFSRAISPYLTKYLKRLSPGAAGGDIVVKNEPAASGKKGLAIIFNARPDGYTIGCMDSGVVTDDVLGRPEYDYGKFSFLLLAVLLSPVIVTSKQGLPNWSEVTGARKKGPVKLATGSFGRSNHVMSILATEKMKGNFKIINFPGTMEAISALMRGDVQLFFGTEDAVRPLVEAGEIKPILTFSPTTGYPGITNVKDIGFPELASVLNSHRFFIGPPGLTAGPRNLLTAALKKATADEEFLAWTKRNKINLLNIYGSEAQKVYQNVVKFYADNLPTIKKHIN